MNTDDRCLALHRNDIIAYAETKPVQPNFDVNAAKESINQMIREGGYYQPVGGSIEAEFEIAGTVADKIREKEADMRNNPHYMTGVDGVKYSSRMDERNRALRREELVNEYRGAMTNKEWAQYFNKIDNDPAYYKTFYYDGDRAVVTVNNKTMLLEMQTNGEFAVKAVYKSPDIKYNRIHDDVHGEIFSKWKDGIYDAEDVVEWASLIASYAGQKVLESYDPDNGRFVRINGRSGRIGSEAYTVYRNRVYGERSLEDGTDGTEGTVKLSIRTDTLSDREILANSFEDIAANDNERKYISRYSTQIDELYKRQQRLAELRDELKREKKVKKPDKARIAKLNTEIDAIADLVNRADKRLLAFEKAKPLQDVLAREREKQRKNALKVIDITAFFKKFCIATRTIQNH